MRTSFASIETGRRALQAQQQAIDVTGHNIANANTTGYSRQVAHLATTTPYTTPTAFGDGVLAGQMGTGVQVKEITRVHDAFIQHQIISELKSEGYWDARQHILGELELTFLEPSEAGLRHAVDLFWESLQGLANDPESEGTRAVVRERALVLTESIQSAYNRFEPLQENLDFRIRSNVLDINGIIDHVTSLNKEIKAVLVAGDTPNDLYDSRDVLLQDLARIVDVQIVDRGDGTVSVGIGGVNVVDGVNSRKMVIRDDDDGMAQLMWEGTNLSVEVRSGELKALFEGRDVDIPYYMDQLNEFARTLIDEINAIHAQGYGLHETFDPNALPDPNNPPPPPGRLFFKDGTVDQAYMDNPAALMSLTDDILQDVGNIAASANGTVGDGTNALNIAQLKHTRIFGHGSETPNGFLGNVVSGIGVKVQQAKTMTEHQEVMIDHLERLKGSISGVSLDEEMTNLIMFQHGYGAASRLITTIDEMIETIIHRMGLVGR